VSLGSSSDVGVELHQGGNLKSSLTKGKNSRGHVFDELALTLLENLLTVWQEPCEKSLFDIKLANVRAYHGILCVQARERALSNS